MKDNLPAGRPNGKPRRPVTCRTSDLEFDFGTPVLPDPRTLCDRWRVEHVEAERGLRADVYRSIGLM